jgi:RimJ/RimL family protein N-acetyltransferase
VKVLLIPLTRDAAEDIKAGRTPVGRAVAADYPTEFSLGIAQSVGHEGNVGPFFVARAEDELVVGEIGGRFTEPGVVEIGYAIVPSYWGAGLATAAVEAFLTRAREHPDAARLRAHTPLTRPASARVVAKAGFRFVAEADDEHEGQALRVQRWEFELP